MVPSRVVKARSKARSAPQRNRLSECTGQRPVGFRGPGFSFSTATSPCFAGLATCMMRRACLLILVPGQVLITFGTQPLARDQREQRASLFGSVADGFRPLKPYRPGGTRWLARDSSDYTAGSFGLLSRRLHLVSQHHFFGAGSRPTSGPPWRCAPWLVCTPRYCCIRWISWARTTKLDWTSSLL